MSLGELLAVFAVYVNCLLLRKDTGVPQYGLFVLSMQCLGFLYTCTRVDPLLSQSRAERMYAMSFKDSCLSEVSLKCVNRKRYLHVPIQYML